MATRIVKVEEYHYAAQRSAVPVMRGRWPTTWGEAWDICWKSKATLTLMAVGFVLQIAILLVGP